MTMISHFPVRDENLHIQHFKGRISIIFIDFVKFKKNFEIKVRSTVRRCNERLHIYD